MHERTWPLLMQKNPYSLCPTHPKNQLESISHLPDVKQCKNTWNRETMWLKTHSQNQESLQTLQKRFKKRQIYQKHSKTTSRYQAPCQLSQPLPHLIMTPWRGVPSASCARSTCPKGGSAAWRTWPWKIPRWKQAMSDWDDDLKTSWENYGKMMVNDG